MKSTAFLAKSALSLFLVVFSSYAQPAARPQPGEIVAEPQNEAADEETSSFDAADAKSRKLAFVRVLNFSPNQQIGVFALGANPESQAIPLVRGSKAPELGRYEELTAGEYALCVQPDAVNPENENSLPKVAQENDLVARKRLSLKPLGFYTILLSGEGSALSADIVEDRESEGRTLQVYNMTPLTFALLQGTDRNIRVLAPTLKTGRSKLPMPPGTEQIFEAYFRYPSGSEARMPVEINSSGFDSLSLVLFRDRYGRVAFQGLVGAPTIESQP